MCVYCSIADWGRQYLPPSYPEPTLPGRWPTYPWTLPMLDEFQELLRRVKELEDKVGGCPQADPSKLDWLKALRDHFDKAIADMTPKPKPERFVERKTPGRRKAPKKPGAKAKRAAVRFIMP